MILADPGGLESLLPDDQEGQRMASESAAMFARLRDALTAGDVEAAARGFVEALGGEGAWERRSEAQKRMLLDNITTGPACAERPRFTRDELAGLPGPILLVTGAASPPRYRRMLAEFMRCNRRVDDLVTIADAAHAMNRENPRAFNDAVMTFLARSSA